MPKDKKKEKKGKQIAYTASQLKQSIMGIFTKKPNANFNYKQIAKRLDIHDVSTKHLLAALMLELKKDKQIEEVGTGKYRLLKQSGYLTGVVDMTAQGSAYVICEGQLQDIYVSQRNLHGALNGDEVKLYVYAIRSNKNPEGEVIQILKRSKQYFVGTMEISDSFAFMIPEGKSLSSDLFIPKGKLNGALNGQKVVAKIIESNERGKNPVGEIIRVLGNAGDNETEMHAILAEFELPYKFDESVLKAAEDISDIITEQEIAKRKDFRNITTITIDPVDAKDFDDALSIQKLENGNYEVGVHIADVTHYVTPNSTLDEEAYKRATSVYLVDRTVPMLPERLSNGICSLKPNEDKLCFAAVFELDENAKIMNEWFGKTIINSNRRFAYEEAQQIIEDKAGELSEEILKLDELAKKIRAKRFKNGSISFDRVEMKFEIDEKGKPLSVFFKESKDANKLIEEFMLLANKRVAEFVGKVNDKAKAKTFVYRVHDEPNMEKLKSFSDFIKKFGYQLKLASRQEITTSLNQLLTDVAGKTEENLIETLAVRSMAKAEYDVKNIGHYGLAFDYYTHFTSPIRRYPDVMVHRLLFAYLQGEASANKTYYAEKCKHSSEMEYRAAQAERSSTKYKAVEFMKDKVGNLYEGVISGVTEWGIYVEIAEYKIEGMVSLREMEDDFYVFDEKNYVIFGKNKNKRFQLGDHVTIQIVRANTERKQLDFIMA